MRRQLAGWYLHRLHRPPPCAVPSWPRDNVRRTGMTMNLPRFIIVQSLLLSSLNAVLLSAIISRPDNWSVRVRRFFISAATRHLWCRLRLHYGATTYSLTPSTNCRTNRVWFVHGVASPCKHPSTDRVDTANRHATSCR